MAEMIMDPRVGSFKDWTDRYRAENDYIKAVGEFKLNEAKAAHEEALARGEQAKARLWNRLIDQLDRDLKRVDNAAARIDELIRKMETRSRNASLLLKGARMDGTALSNAWS